MLNYSAFLTKQSIMDTELLCRKYNPEKNLLLF